ncbi:hypothetical protein ACPESN_13855 [Stutzerimonas marianensis]|uniref:hypothetical protein n=1 Tax=Stutzerimonas marianensis TaxID=2929513 RepID=UPI003C2FD1DD
MNRLFKMSILAVAVAPAIALAAPQAGDREITLSGAGSSDKSFDDTVFSVQGSWGKYLDESSMWGIRQTINARDEEGESVQFDGSTRVFYDYHFGSGNTRPFVGLSLGGLYGEEVDETFMGGPEVGVSTGCRTRPSSRRWLNTSSCSRVAAMRATVMTTVRSSTVLVSVTTSECVGKCGAMGRRTCASFVGAVPFSLRPVI